MRKIKVQDLKKGLVSNIHIQLPGKGQLEKERYFEWEPSNLIAEFISPAIRGGILRSRKSEFVFDEIETHIDTELFLFLEGTAVMPFIDISDDQPIMGSMQIVRIQPGTQISIPPGKGHFVPIPEGEIPLKIIIIAPEMGDIILKLPEPVSALF